MATVTSVTKHFATAKEGFTTTLASTIASGAATVPLNSVTGYSNGEVVALVIEPTSTTAKQVFTGTVDTAGVQITGVVWTEGTNQTHNAGVTVVDYWTATHQAMMVKGLTALGANQAGTITPKVTTSINDSNGNEAIRIPATASAVNDVTVTNSATGVDPRISATGDDANLNLNLRGKGLAKTVTIGAGSTTIFPYDYVVSGCVITADSVGVNKNYSMTSGVVVINGNPITVASFAAAVGTASKDCYVDVLDNGDGTGLVVKTGGNEVNNNAASPALASNSIRIGIVVEGAASIATTASINQGQEDRVLPIASSIPYAVTDSLGNLICPRDPNRKVIGYRQVVTNLTSTTAVGSGTDMTGLNLTCIIPTGRKVRVSGFIGGGSASIANNAIGMELFDVTASALIANSTGATNASGDVASSNPSAISSAGGTRNYKARLFRGANAATANSNGSATNPNYILVELV